MEPRTEDTEELPAGTTISGGYVLEGPVARGRTRIVYAARAQDGGLVAVHVLDSGLVDGLGEWLMQSAALRAAQPHTAFPRTLTTGTLDDGRPFEVTELLDGTSMREALDTSPGGIDAPAVLHVVSEVAAALDALHGQRPVVVLRTLSPEHVVVLRDTLEVRVLGLHYADRPQFEGVRPGYRSPEELAGVTSLGARADVFSLATFAYELLTGRVAWPHVPELALDGMRVGIRDRVSVLKPAIPAEADAVFERAWSLSPDARHSSAMSFARALRKAVDPDDTAGSARAVFDDRPTTQVPGLFAKLRASTLLDAGAAAQSIDALLSAQPPSPAPSAAAPIRPQEPARSLRARRTVEEPTTKVETPTVETPTVPLPSAIEVPAGIAETPREKVEAPAPPAPSTPDTDTAPHLAPARDREETQETRLPEASAPPSPPPAELQPVVVEPVDEPTPLEAPTLPPKADVTAAAPLAVPPTHAFVPAPPVAPSAPAPRHEAPRQEPSHPVETLASIEVSLPPEPSPSPPRQPQPAWPAPTPTQAPVRDEPTQMLTIPQPSSAAVASPPHASPWSTSLLVALMFSQALMVVGVAHAIAWALTRQPSPATVVVPGPSPTCAPCAACPQPATNVVEPGAAPADDPPAPRVLRPATRPTGRTQLIRAVPDFGRAR